MNIQNHYTIEQQWIILPLSITLSQTSYIFNIKMIANIPQTPNRILFVVSLKIRTVWSHFSNLFVAYILSWSFFFLILVIRGRLLSISNTGIFLAGLFVFRVFLVYFFMVFFGGGVNNTENNCQPSLLVKIVDVTSLKFGVFT